MRQSLSRRDLVVGASAGLGALVLGLVGRRFGFLPESLRAGQVQTVLGAQTPAVHTVVGAPLVTESQALTALLHPLAPGSTVEGARLERVGIDSQGIGVVQLATAQGALYQVDVCAREKASSSVQPIAESQHYALFLRNSGQGDTPTDESMGLSVMGLADTIRRNESDEIELALVSKSEIWDRGL